MTLPSSMLLISLPFFVIERRTPGVYRLALTLDFCTVQRGLFGNRARGIAMIQLRPDSVDTD
jgi:hypothetical protein